MTFSVIIGGEGSLGNDAFIFSRRTISHFKRLTDYLSYLISPGIFKKKTMGEEKPKITVGILTGNYYILRQGFDFSHYSTFYVFFLYYSK